MTAPAIASLDEHPHRASIDRLNRQILDLTDSRREQLDGLWQDPRPSAPARHLALSPGSPLIVDVLDAMCTVQQMWPLNKDGQLLLRGGLNCTFDAIAATYAQPILSQAQYDALMGPWGTVHR